MYCEICKKEIEYDPANFALHHLKKHHNINGKQYYDAFFKKQNEGICRNPNCNNKTKYKSFKIGYFDFCSKKCADTDSFTRKKAINTFKKTFKENRETILIKRKQTCLEKYGDENYSLIGSDSFRKNLLKKYGDENYSNREKRKQTCLERYGTENPYLYGSDEFKELMIKKYGVEFYSQYGYDKILNTTRQNRKNIFLDELKKLKWTLLNDLNNFNKDQHFDFKCELCGRIQYNVRSASIYLLSCPCRIFRSSGEIELLSFIESLGIYETLCNKQFTIEGIRKEIDIYIPSHNLGIEFDGLYWHSEGSPNNIHKNYHLEKTNFFENIGIKIIHVFENEWNEKQDIVKSIIRNKLGLIENRIFARKCEIKEIDSEQARVFCENHHIQGYTKSSLKYGLFYDNECVSVMLIGKSRFKKNEIELIRFCNRLNTSVIGGFSKLLKNICKTNSIKRIISYCDKRYFDGSGYEQIGFKILNNTPPNYFYWKSNKFFNRQQFMKHKLKDKLETFDLELTEWENMQLNGYDRIWDCGNIKLIKEL